MQNRILELTCHLMQTESLTHTDSEHDFEEELMKIIQEMDYFKVHPQYAGFQELHDGLSRRNVYALIKGKGNKTLVMINHHDVVSLDAYGHLKELAYDSERLKEALKSEEKDEEILKDIESNEWLFGRGSCDMKGGMAAELATLEKYSQISMKGNLLFLSVCDEETYSLGMRHAQTLLAELAEMYNLEYVYAVNPEPSAHIRQGHVASFGSIGKCLAMIHAAGIPSHISSIEKGINPITLLNEIIRQIEYSEDFVDHLQKEFSTPPVFNYYRDSKDYYDYSLAHYASASCSIMMFQKSLAEIASELKRKCEKGIQYYHERMEIKMKACSRKYEKRKITVYTFDELKKICEENHVLPELKLDEKFLFEGSRYIEACLEKVPWIQPCVIISFIPPYYPPILSRDINYGSTQHLATCLDHTLRSQNLHLEKENYFKGVSDGSYLRRFDHQDLTYLMYDEKEYYLDKRLKQDIPVVVCGPWGKDLHLRSERVHISSLCHTCPSIIETMIQELLEHEK